MNQAQLQKQQYIVDHGDAAMAYCFAHDVPDADIQALEQVVIAEKNATIACDFAEDINGANIKALEQVVVQYGDSSEILYFAKRVPSADTRALEQALIRQSDEGSPSISLPIDTYCFARDVKGSNIEALFKIVEASENKSLISQWNHTFKSGEQELSSGMGC